MKDNKNKGAETTTENPAIIDFAGEKKPEVPFGDEAIVNTPSENAIVDEPKPLEVLDPESGEVKEVAEITVMPSVFGHEDFAKLVASSKSLEEKKNSVSLTPTYLQFETAGTKVRGVFCGYTTISKKDATTQELTPIKCATWMENGKTFMAGGVALVDEFEKRNLPIGTSVEITYTGKKGNTKLFDLSIIY